MCSDRELQKRLYNKERYEQYEEQQKNLKHNRYSIQQHQQRQQQTYSVQTATSVYAQQAQVPPHYANSNNTAANPTPAPSTSSQIPMQLPQMPIGLGGGNASANLPPPPNLATPTNSNNASPQISTLSSSSMMLGINMKGNNSSNKQHTFQTQQLHMHQVIQPSLPLPNPSIAAQKNRASNRAASNASIATNVNLISLDEFVEELKRHIDFDRKLYHIDIQSLIESMGPSAGFTQLGRKICEKVLEGTKFNFSANHQTHNSLKDRRRSTKSPDTLSTLRYYCSQRIDTAKPRKAEHPKAQLKYDCAGALTIIIDLLKKSAHVTQHQISKQFEQLKQTVNEIGLLLDSQTPYANEDFLKVATEALSEAGEMVRACKAAEENSDVIYPPNKYTLHYKKRGDYGNLF
ncbi:hypothetical protein CU097_015922 [Rhizopus azygosporus]|uniref:Uncharacterized protein n=1 Tax=Rhizopus azygosporus TaxID=86630 RepID=A0A367KHA2_RHIAZ|nr:hypothetical protein CU097_015922 [Rhizopus azygosporus]